MKLNRYILTFVGYLIGDPALYCRHYDRLWYHWRRYAVKSVLASSMEPYIGLHEVNKAETRMEHIALF